MTLPTESPPEAAEPLFDVVVKMPPGARLEDIERLGLAADIPPDRLAKLIGVLRSVPEAKIGAAVNRERADKARSQFSKAGLQVQITPVLSLQATTAGSFDTLITCPACAKRVQLPDNRQCPNCGVFVDKLTDEFLLKRKMMEQERARIESQLERDGRNGDKRTREALEASMREKIRKELEKEYGLHKKAGLFEGRKGLLRGVGLAGLLVAAFAGGNASSSSGWSLGGKAGASSSGGAGGSSAADVDRMLNSIGPKVAGGAGAPGAAGAPTGDADIDDPLIQAAGGKRIGAKGLTIEQAVAASQSLAKIVGNTTAERAMAGTGGGGAGGGAGGAAAGEPGAASVPMQARLVLTAEFASELAELGQGPRAREVIRALKASPQLASEPAAAPAVRLAGLEVQAWAIAQLSESRARTAVDALKAEATALSDAAERAVALSRVGVILSQQPLMPREAPRAFLTLASDALKTVSDARQRAPAVGEWAVSLARVLQVEVEVSARAGQWSRARAAGDQIQALVQNAPDAGTQTRLFAVHYRAKKLLGQPDSAVQSLEGALSLVTRNKNPAEQAAWLHDMARLSGAASHERIQAFTAELQAQLEASPGMARAQGLTALSLMHAQAGLRAKADQYRTLAQATPGLSPADAMAINTSLVVRGDMAQARALQDAGLYSEAEVVLQRVGGYLL